MDRTSSYCVIGAGTCGLAVAKNLEERGVPVEVMEQQDDVGGNWYFGSPSSTMYDSAHLISSKRLAGYLDYPMPDHYPDYPGHRQVLDYLRAYATEFGLYEAIEFNRSVTEVAPAEEGGWQVTLDGAESRRYRGVVVANGHHNVPRYPNIPGCFDGVVLHSASYKTPDVFAGKQVLVVGGGNSGCDIAVDAVPFAARTLHSMRRGYHFWPKLVMGRPIDEINELTHRLRMPLRLRRLAAGLLLRATVGRNRDYGLPEPDHRLFESHLVINSRLLYHLKHGDITAKPDVTELRGGVVRFADGTEEKVDLILYATGFAPAWSFLGNGELRPAGTAPNLYLNIFHPDHDDLFAVGLVQPDVGIWRLADLQSRLVARAIEACDEGGAAAARFRARKRGTPPRLSPYRYQHSPRHSLEVEHVTYERLLSAELSRLDRDLGARRRSRPGGSGRPGRPGGPGGPARQAAGA
jgi:thioredoxin reductase